jgi:hypothetical protein
MTCETCIHRQWRRDIQTEQLLCQRHPTQRRSSARRYRQ